MADFIFRRTGFFWGPRIFVPERMAGDSLKIKSRVILRKNDRSKIVSSLKDIFGDAVDAFSASKFEVVTTDEGKIIFVDGKQMFMELEGQVFLTVRGALAFGPQVRRVVVDMGAVKFVVNGADIMSPGITAADDGILKDDLVVIVDESHKKPLAVGKALMSGPEMVESTSGKAVKSLLHVGDAFWEMGF